MTWEAETLGFEEWDGTRWEGIPDDPSEAAGMWVHSHNDETGEDQYTWIWTYTPFVTFDEWIDHIDLVLSGHGIVLG